jgi:hypothetical protein
MKVIPETKFDIYVLCVHISYLGTKLGGIIQWEMIMWMSRTVLKEQ